MATGLRRVQSGVHELHHIKKLKIETCPLSSPATPYPSPLKHDSGPVAHYVIACTIGLLPNDQPLSIAIQDRLSGQVSDQRPPHSAIPITPLCFIPDFISRTMRFSGTRPGSLRYRHVLRMGEYFADAKGSSMQAMTCLDALTFLWSWLKLYFRFISEVTKSLLKL